MEKNRAQKIDLSREIKGQDSPFPIITPPCASERHVVAVCQRRPYKGGPGWVGGNFGSSQGAAGTLPVCFPVVWQFTQVC